MKKKKSWMLGFKFTKAKKKEGFDKLWASQSKRKVSGHVATLLNTFIELKKER